MSSACEVDICGVVGMHALQLASATPSALLDWNNNYGDDPDKAVCFHCSNLPKHFFDDVRMDFQEIIAGTVGKENTFGTCVGRVKAGADELRALLHQRSRRARFAATSARASSPTIRWRPSAARAWCEIPQSAGPAALHLRAAASSITWRPTSRTVGAGGARSRHALSGLGRVLAQLSSGDVMSIVAGVDFGTLSVRVSIFDSAARPAWARASAEYPLHAQEGRSRSRHAEPRRSHERAGRGHAHARSTTRASTAQPIEAHRARHHRLERDSGGREPRAARRLLSLVRPSRLAGSRARSPRPRTQQELEAIDWCGGIYSSEWGFAKLLHWLRHNPDKRARIATALEHCDMVAAVLCGITDPAQVPRSICAMGHKWMWNEALGGLAAGGVSDARRSAARRRARETRRALCDLGPDRRARLSPEWAEKLGLRAGIPDSGRRLRRALGRHRRGRAAGRRGQRGRHLHLHHGDQRRSRSDPRRLRRGARLDSSAATPASKRGSRPPATSSTPSRAAPARRSRSFRAGSKTTAPGRPGCCASPGTTAIAPCW